MSIIQLILSFFGGIISEVLKDVLNTPATTTSVETVKGDIELPLDGGASSAIVDKYAGVFNRG